MFCDELIFEDVSIFFEQTVVNYNAMDDHGASLEDNEVKGVKKRKIKENKNNQGSSESKKNVHREIERQGRQETAALYASLRSLLPLEYVKGRRAVCDHIEQVVNYIKDTQNKIKELTKIRRNKLNKLSSPNSNKMDYDSVKVNLSRDIDGMDILITTELHQEYCFPLSKVLAYLLGLGLNVTTCVYTTDDHYSFYKLQTELNEITSIDISELKERLVHLIKDLTFAATISRGITYFINPQFVDIIVPFIN